MLEGSGEKRHKKTIGVKFTGKKVKQGRDFSGYIQRKFTPELFSEMVAGLNVQQKKWVKDTGFGGLLQFQMLHYPRRLGYKVVEAFDGVASALKLEGGNVEISDVVVEKVLGLPNGKSDIEFTTDKSDEDLWAEQFENKPRAEITPRMVYDKIKRYEEVDKIFKLNFLVLMSNFLIESHSNAYVNREILRFRGNLEECFNYKWCELLIRRLKSSHKYWVREPSTRHFTGSLPFLIVSVLSLYVLLCSLIFEH